LALALVLGLSAIVRATVLIPADLAELTADATAIVHGRVVDVRADWLAGRRTVIPPAIVSPDVEPVRLVRGDPKRPSPTIEAFAADIRALLARKAGAR
jgi:hypothetical protein